ncbi:multiple sugar transport system substrate-binding protein [Bacillus tianshenii]|uniref:Multiple sugar transport system substrate-binding protein n=1 Tax=Sutcliffiella tianshenii TaxID=1463404 RepID=A0ABS2P2N7_9BACI|nr:ABC transporter substrate-binding protein [Bacillus tianshenii]MBM7621202.1 multiple sugar transport system substrate-binding protein [Bacillus tianshenii]
MRSRFIAGVSILLILSMVIMAGCSNSSAGNDGKVTIDFWYTWGGDEAEEMKKLIKEYNDSQDEVFVKGLSQGDVQKQMTSIVGGNPPDLASHPDENKIATWAERGAITPLDEFIEKDKYDMEDFLPAARAAVQYEEKTYALPIVMNTWMLYYNKDLLEEAGLDGPPETVQELEEYNEKLSVVKDGRIERLGIWPAGNPYMWMNAFGGQLWDAEKKEVAVLEPGFKNTMELNKRMWDMFGSDAIDRMASAEGQYDSAQNSFFTGKYAMSFDGEWLATFIKRYAPNFNYGIAPMPYDANNPETKNSGFINVGTLYIPKGASHPEEAWDFLSWLTEKEQMVKFAASLGNLPTRTSAVDDPIFDDVPEYDTFMNYVVNGNMQSVPSVPFLEEFLQEVWTVQDEIMRDKVSVDEGLQKIKDKIQPIADEKNQ